MDKLKILINNLLWRIVYMLGFTMLSNISSNFMNVVYLVLAYNTYFQFHISIAYGSNMYISVCYVLF